MVQRQDEEPILVLNSDFGFISTTSQEEFADWIIAPRAVASQKQSGRTMYRRAVRCIILL